MKISLPNNWKPRDYQQRVWSAIENGKKRICLVAHRRYGKDDICLHAAATWAFKKPATYWHMLPQATQARKAIWEAVNPHTGIRRIDEAFPHEIRKTTREQEMMIKFINGSTWQVVGSDNFNSLVGSPPYGIVFSEYALSNPNAWAYLKPILEENDGIAAFIYTPRGKNHGYSLFKLSEKNPDKWYSEKTTVESTSVFSEEQLQESLVELQGLYGEDAGRSFWLQEYYTSFDAALPGAYYIGELARAEKEGRITSIAYDSSLPVITVWDIGRNDYTAIWFVQEVGNHVRFIDYYQNNMKGIEHYARKLKEKGYLYESHVLPHDAGHVQIGSYKNFSVKKQLQELLTKENFIIQKRTKSEISDIYMAKGFFNRCVFDKQKCELGIESLGAFAQEYSEKHKVFTGVPAKGWFKHGADAFRYAVVHFKDKNPRYKIESRGGETFADVMQRITTMNNTRSKRI